MTRRLVRSARLAHLFLELTPEDLADAAVTVARRNGVRTDSHFRAWCFAAGNPTGPMVPAGTPCEAVIDSWEFASGLGDPPRTCRAAVTSWTRISPNAMPPQIKAFSNYHNGRLGNIDVAARGADRPIFLDDQQRVTESAGATVGLFEDGVFITPSLGCGILDSITRETVIELLRTDLGVPVEERNVGRLDLYRADELVFVGTSAEVLPIVQIDDHVVGNGAVGPLTRLLRAEYEAVLRGQRPKRNDWLTSV